MINENQLETYQNEIDWDKIKEIKTISESKLNHPSLNAYIKALELAPLAKPSHIDFCGDEIIIGKESDLTPKQHHQILECLKLFMPWKKGPFRIFGHEINSEWQSQIKWKKISNHMKPIKNKVVADIGCHNGYFMFKMLEHNPKLVVGFEPYAKHKLTFRFLQQYVRSPKLCFEMLGIEHINYFPQFFDSIFCLGILYHHTDPIGILRKMYQSLKKGGELIIDCQGIAGHEPNCIVPKSRYAGAKGIWFLPTESALCHWLQRANFKNIKVIHNEPLTSIEQRTTEWAPIKSLKDFLDPKDSSKTIEGYPAPHRIYVIARKP